MLVAVWFWLFAWVMWWVNVALGVQGASPMLAIIAILSLPVILRKRPALSRDVIAFGVFIIWCVASTFWSPGASSGLFVFDPENSNYAISSPGLRIALTSLICAFAYWALHQLSEKQYQHSARAVRIGLGIQVVLTALWALAFQLVFQVAGEMTDIPSAFQNMIRIVNISVLMVPLAAISLPVKSVAIKWAAGTVMMLGLATLTSRDGFDAGAALLAIAAVTATVIATAFFGRQIFRLLGLATAVAVMAMPFAVQLLLNAVSHGSNMSSQSRLDSWSYVLDKIKERPITGWGVEASKTWDETIRIIGANGLEVDYRIVPGHPHNGGLQIWAETGLIGALLISAFALLLGDRLARTSSPSKQIMAAGAALWGGGLVYSAISYSVWNDAYWATFLFLGTGIYALSRTLPRTPEATA